MKAQKSLFAILMASTTVLVACLDDPVLKDCDEFPFATNGCPGGCTAYCEQAFPLCSDELGTLEGCISTCEEAGSPDGAPGATSGDSLSCRLTQAQAGNCEGAIFSGNLVCNDVCAEYCAAMLSACPAAYPSETNCEGNCLGFPQGSARVGNDTRECRNQFAQEAVDEVETQGRADVLTCNRAGIGGGDVCPGEPCQAFCDLLDRNCPGQSPFVDRAQCITACETLPVGNFDDWEDNLDSLSCRLYHGGFPANSDPNTHCRHTGIYNQEQCGISSPRGQPGWPCDTYCRLIDLNCPGKYPNDAACEAACFAFPEVQNLDNTDLTAQPNIYPLSTQDCNH